MVYQIGTDRVVHVHLKRQLQFRAHAIDARNQDGIDILGLINRKQTAKSPNLAEDALRESLMGKVLNALLGAIGFVDVYACVGIGNGFG